MVFLSEVTTNILFTCTVSSLSLVAGLQSKLNILMHFLEGITLKYFAVNIRAVEVS